MIGALAGCDKRQTAPDTRSQQETLRRGERGDALLKAAASQLADLPAAVDTELRPPTVILDSTKSANGADVLAVGFAHPNAPDGPINIISVPDQNSRFRSIGVKPGDILKYYIVEDETVDEERRQAGLTRQLAKELTVAQVIDDSTLLIEGSLAQEMLIPAKLEVWRYLDDRLVEIHEKLSLYAERRLPPLGWEPSPDQHVLVQVVAWLNQWLRQSEPKTDWVAAATGSLLDSLDPQIRSDPQLAPHISSEALAAQVFQPYDGRLLQEAVWLRDISRWAQGDNFNDVARATALFDWTVRNVQLVADEDGAAHRPWQVLLYGRGTAEQRAWVFALLSRQQGLHVVMLEIPEAEGKKQKAEGQQVSGPQPSALRPHPFWLPALLLDGQLYLFDTRLGLPIPGPGGEGVATLAQVEQDESLLRQLDLDDSPYHVQAGALQHVVAYVVADPFELSRRAEQVESKLTGDDHLVLTSAAGELAARLKSVPQLADVKMWDVPFRTLRDQLTLGRAARQREALAFEPFAMRPVLWKARTRHFQGRRQLEDKSQDEAIDDHREAVQLYRTVRPPDREIAQIASAEERRVKGTAKLNATYWVGLLSFDEGKFEIATHWLGLSELAAADSPWSSGARYNLARTFEAQGNFKEAVQLLEQGASPQRHGNHLRARSLKARLEVANQSESE